MIEDLHHIQIAMPKGQEEAARRFYSGILGLVEVEKPAVLRGRGGLWFESGSVKVHLGVDDPFVPAKKAHPGFRVGSLETVTAHLEKRDVAFQTDIDLPDIRRIYVNDPFGNRIELLELRTT